MNGIDQQLNELKNDPRGMAKRAGYDIPEQLMGNPQAMVMHLIQTGQVSNPMIQRILPMLRGK